MGHRAVVAYRTGDESLRLHYAHWGGGLADRIDADAPFGGIADAPVPAERAADLEIDPAAGYDPPTATAVDPRPLATDVDPADAARAVDETVETVVVVSPSFHAETYLVCPLGLGGSVAEIDDRTDAADGRGDLVLAGPTDDPASLRRWYLEAASGLDRAVDGGDVPPEVARRILLSGLERRAAAVVTPREALAP